MNQKHKTGPRAMPFRTLHVRVDPENFAWLEKFAMRNGNTLTASIREILRGARQQDEDHEATGHPERKKPIKPEPIKHVLLQDHLLQRG